MWRWFGNCFAVVAIGSTLGITDGDLTEEWIFVACAVLAIIGGIGMAVCYGMAIREDEKKLGHK